MDKPDGHETILAEAGANEDVLNVLREPLQKEGDPDINNFLEDFTKGDTSTRKEGDADLNNFLKDFATIEAAAEQVNEKENFLFGDGTRFIELMIAAELDEDEDYEVIKTHLLESLVDAYQYAQYEGFERYTLLDKQIMDSGKDMTLSLGIDFQEPDMPEDELESFTFTEFTEALIFQLSCSEKDDSDSLERIKEYELTAKGLLEAVKGFYKEVAEKKHI